MRALAREWVKKAEEDYSVAGSLRRRRKNPAPNSLCFHCQQCAEKYLKARLIEAGEIPARTHDLAQLLLACQRHEPLWSALMPGAKLLSQFGVAFRYPGNDAHAHHALLAWKHATAIRREARHSLGL
jgi:HEPN domain-containing protein